LTGKDFDFSLLHMQDSQTHDLQQQHIAKCCSGLEDSGVAAHAYNQPVVDTTTAVRRTDSFAAAD
jgi:hypothetical protein